MKTFNMNNFIHIRKIIKKLTFILKTIPNVSIISQINLHTISKGKYIVYKTLYSEFNRSSSIIINRGVLSLGKSWVSKYRGSNLLLMKSNSRILVNNDFIIYNNFNVVINENAELNLGGGYINQGLVLECSKKITIGRNVAIGTNVTIRDGDSKHLYINECLINRPSPIVIEDEVWIGDGAKILKGVTIGKGAVVASGAVVCNDVKSKTVVAGIPAVVIKENIRWSS